MGYRVYGRDFLLVLLNSDLFRIVKAFQGSLAEEYLFSGDPVVSRNGFPRHMGLY
jgi:hypothetical protein